MPKRCTKHIFLRVYKTHTPNIQEREAFCSTVLKTIHPATKETIHMIHMINSETIHPAINKECVLLPVAQKLVNG
jgi:hypothetical protein